MVNGKSGDLKGPACIQRTDLSIPGILPPAAPTPLPPTPLLPVARSASLTLPLGTCCSGRVPPTPSPPGCPAHWQSCGLCLRPSWPAHLCSHLGTSSPFRLPVPPPWGASRRRPEGPSHQLVCASALLASPWPTGWSLSSPPSPVAPPVPPPPGLLLPGEAFCGHPDT